MLTEKLQKTICYYKDFPKAGINFVDLMPVLNNPNLFKDLIDKMSKNSCFSNADAIIAIDARGFIFGSAIAYLLAKPLITARKPGKLPGILTSKSYDLEYGSNEISIQKELLDNYERFAIVDDILATGGTVKCVEDILFIHKKIVTGISVVIELGDLSGSSRCYSKVFSEISL